MAKPGPKPKRSKPPEWTPELAYAIGLLVSDGNLSVDGRHIDLTSKDHEQVATFKRCLDLTNKIERKNSGSAKQPNLTAYRIQFGDVELYRWLLSIGLHPHKSKTIEVISVPGPFFRDFVRGYYDGDGSTRAFWDIRWRSSYMFYTSFCSTSHPYLVWLRNKLHVLLGVNGHVWHTGSAWKLCYAKKESKKLYSFMYYDKKVPCLQRKREKLERFLAIDDENNNARVSELVDDFG